MNNLVSFTHGNSEFPISIIDNDGERWAPAQQIGDALGTVNIRDLIKSLRENGELIEDKHFCRLNLQKSERGNPNVVALSLRGIIRVSMRSEGERAIAFRDWAESVLYEVMVTGSYSGQPIISGKNFKEAETIAMCHVRLAKAMGTSVEMARIIGLDVAKKHTGVDFKGLLIGCNAVEERPVTATELGKNMNPMRSPREVNKLLEDAGFQNKDDKDGWKLTEKGKSFGSLEPYKSEHSNHTGYRILWNQNVINELTESLSAE